MGLTWTPWALPGFLGFLVAWGGAVVLLRTAAHRAVNRRLAVVLLVEGLWMGGVVFFLVRDPDVFLAIGAVAVAAMAALPLLYLAFLGAALDTPLVAPFRTRAAAVLLGLGSAAMAVWVLLSPSAFLGELYSPPWATWNFRFTPMGQWTALALGAVSLFGLVAALDAWRRARPGTAARSRARWFAVAFGLRDVYTGSTMILYPVIRDAPFWGDFLYNAGQGCIYLVFAALLAYAVLRTQLFDLDLKIKLALERSTVGSAFGVAFFIGQGVLESLVPVDGAILGLAVSAALVLALRPVRRFAETVASRLMPGVEDSPDYLRRRKEGVYRAALEGAIRDGRITGTERAILTTLRAELGVPDRQAERLERDVLRPFGRERRSALSLRA